MAGIKAHAFVWEGNEQQPLSGEYGMCESTLGAAQGQRRNGSSSAFAYTQAGHAPTLKASKTSFPFHANFRPHLRPGPNHSAIPTASERISFASHMRKPWHRHHGSSAMCPLRTPSSFNPIHASMLRSGISQQKEKL